MNHSFLLNYKDIDFSFRFKFWDVSSAVHISSGIEVSIWKFTPTDQIKKYSDLEINSFLGKYRNSLIALQHIRHSNILRIFEISGEGEELYFSSERISNVLSNETNLTNQESFLALSQLAEACRYLHQELNVAHLALSPDNIYFSPQFDLKLGNLVHFAKFSDYTSNIVPNLYPIDTSIFDVDPLFTSPELRKREFLTPAADVYSYGLVFLFSLNCPISNEPLNISEYNLDIDLQQIIGRCTMDDPGQRPTFEQIRNQLSLPNIIPMQLRVLNFLLKIGENSVEYRKSFYKNLSGMISDYSSRLLSVKIVPILVKEIQDNPEFSNQLINIILLAAEKLEPFFFENSVLRPLFESENNANEIIDRGLMMNNSSIFIPILIATIESPNSQISSRSQELIKSFSGLENIKSIFPLFDKYDNEEIISIILSACKGNVELTDISSFIITLKRVYKKFSTNKTILESISKTLSSLPPHEAEADKTISLSLKLVKSDISSDLKEKLMKYVQLNIKLINESLGITDSYITVDSASGSNSDSRMNLCSDSSRKGRTKTKKNLSLADFRNCNRTFDSQLISKKVIPSQNSNLYSLPKDITFNDNVNPFARNIESFTYRHIEQNMDFIINDLDPFRVTVEYRRRKSDMGMTSDSTDDDSDPSINEADNEINPSLKKQGKSHHRSKSKDSGKSSRRSFHSASIPTIPGFNNDIDPFAVEDSRISESRNSQYGKSDYSNDSDSDNNDGFLFGNAMRKIRTPNPFDRKASLSQSSFGYGSTKEIRSLPIRMTDNSNYTPFEQNQHTPKKGEQVPFVNTPPSVDFGHLHDQSKHEQKAMKHHIPTPPKKSKRKMIDSI